MMIEETRPIETIEPADPWHLSRFISAQEPIYDRAIAELKRGQKKTHWMWYIFPQLEGLGFSSTARFYGIKGREEAQHYLEHPILGTRILECAQILLDIEGRSVADIFGYPDDLKLKSSMTLFSTVAEANSIFSHVLDNYFQGERDRKTLDLLA